MVVGQVQVMFDATASSLPHITAGKLRALAATTATRLEVMPDIPAVGEFLPGYEAIGWAGLGTPQGTAAEIISKLNLEVNAALIDLKIKARFAELGVMVAASSP